MRKILCILCGLLMSAALFAELGAPNSLENALTGGVFENEFDSHFTPNADFGTYDQHFIYGGLGNPLAGMTPKNSFNINETQIQAWQQQLFDTESPMRFGYYMPGSLPMSFFVSFGVGALDRNGENLTGIITARPKPKTETEWTDENRTTMVSVTKTRHYLKPLFEKSRFSFQYLIGVGTKVNLVTGLQFEYTGGNDWNTAFGTKPDTNWKWWDDAYAKVKRTNYDDSSLSYTENKKGLGADVAPGITDALSLLNNLRIKPKEAKAVSKDAFTFKVPAAFALGGLNHYAAVSVTTELENRGGAYYFQQNEEEKDYASTITKLKNEVRAEYGIEIPAERNGDSWLVDAGIQFDIKTKINRWSYTYKTAGIHAAGKYSAKQTPSITFAFDVTGSRMLKFTSPQKSLRFNIKPTLKLDVKTGMADSSNKFRDDGYDTAVSASGSVNGTKVTHSHITKGERGSSVTKTVFTSIASVPMGLKILPDGWKVGFLLGAVPEISYEVTTTSDSKSEHKGASITEQNTVNGADDGSGFTNKPKYPSNIARDIVTEKTYSWAFREQHTIGLTVPFENGAHLDIRVNGSLLEIEGFAIQAFIPLGTGKKTSAAE